MAKPKKTDSDRGLGWDHRRQRAKLLRNLRDGAPCWWCDRPLRRDPARNFDKAKLEADHSIARSKGGEKADRLLHRFCNRSRAAGDRDHLRPALGPQPTAETITTRQWF